MPKWFDQAAEIARLRKENERQVLLINALNAKLEAAGIAPEANPYGVSDAERAAASAGKKVEAVKQYRQRTGADLLTAKKAIDSVL